MIHRRNFIKYVSASALVLALHKYVNPGKAFAAETYEKLVLTSGEWKKRLTAEQYNILREEGTERSFTSELLNEHREGTFACVACGLPLFPSKFKYDSGTGWPSFYDAIEGHLETKTDYKLVYPRTEYHCAKCGGHHGHVFDDGPKPTGLRYCNNGAVLTFIPAE